ncbi:MAG: hypothetical protein WBP45_12630 [Daejeonella sp.]
MDATHILSEFRSNNYNLDTSLKELIRSDINIKFDLALKLYPDFTVNDRNLILYLLSLEIELYEAWGVPLSLKVCIIMLYKLGNVEDCKIIWQAKTINFDTMSSIDIEFLLGGGLSQTISFLENDPELNQLTKVASNKDPEVYLNILDYINSCNLNGEFEFLEDNVQSSIYNFEDALDDFYKEREK